ncbi:MAG: DUF1311 domain-containing protein [Proteobacteria bacterium]|nr:DUF1311 domain-containing protein [Pseudomonadota bacterium]
MKSIIHSSRYNPNPHICNLLLTIILLVIIFTVVQASGAEYPSFDCRKAKTCVEKFICSHAEIAKLDIKMSEEYRHLLSKLHGKDKEQVKQNQRRWIKGRDERCEPAPKMIEKVIYKNIFTALYIERIEEFQEWEKYIDGKTTTTYAPWHPTCWMRQQPFVGKPFWSITGTAPVCRAFEQILNTTCETPDEIHCSLTLPADEKRFQKLNWQHLEFKEYKDVIEEIILDKGRKWNWNQKNPEVKKAFDEGRFDISITAADIFGGKTKKVVRISWKEDCPGICMYGVIDTETKRIDWQYESALLHLNASKGSDIMLYEGKVYKFGWQPGFDLLFIWDERISSICQFEYLKGKGDK